MHPFRRAVETGDVDQVLELVSQDVVFNSPVVYRPYHGRDTLGLILRAVQRVFEDFRYEYEIGAEGARHHALLFRRGWATANWRGATSCAPARTG